MIIVLMALSAVTILRTASEANHIDNVRTAHSLRNAIHAEGDELLALVRDNAEWDEAAAAVYSEANANGFALANYTDSSAPGALSDSVIALRRDGTTVINLHDGAVSQDDPFALIGADLRTLLDRVARAGPAHALIRSRHGLRWVAAAQVIPSSPEQLARFRATAPAPVYLVYTRPINGAALSAIGNELLLRDIRLIASSTERRGFSLLGHELAMTGLSGIDGQLAAVIGWRASRPGYRAIVRSLPFIGLALLSGLLASILLLRRGYASVSEINRIAMVDSLSDLPNRRALRRQTRRALSEHREVAIAFIDLDGFKTVNDLYGHGVGDELIVQCAQVIARIAPSPGAASRLGGDEFALMACGPDADLRLEQAVDTLLERLHEPFHIGDRTIAIGASIGLSNRVTAGDSVSELMREADVAMYVAKRLGKMQRAWFDPAYDRDRTAALEVENRLRLALDSTEFGVVYQPMIDAQSGAVRGFEALLRWDGSGGEAIGPDTFIPIAEDTGLIDRLGEFVLLRACADALAWGTLSLSVNVSVAQLRNPRFPSLVARVLDETGFAPQRLVIEMTEAYLVDDPQRARQAIDNFRAQGIRVALDDFGKGSASIGLLRQFAFDQLKVDRTLVAEAMTDAAAQTMLRSSIALARALQIATVAEGIESEAQAIVMRAAGCDLLQGWHFAREGDASTSAALVSQHHPREQQRG